MDIEIETPPGAPYRCDRWSSFRLKSGGASTPARRERSSPGCHYKYSSPITSPISIKFSHIIAAGPDHQPLSAVPSFIYLHTHGLRGVPVQEHSGWAPDADRKPGKKRRVYGAPGAAWVWRRSAFDQVGGLIEHGILGAGDHYMALSLIGEIETGLDKRFTEEYRRPILAWQERADRTIKCDIGYIDGTLWHYWHGSYANRRYDTRAQILVHNQFDRSPSVGARIACQWFALIALPVRPSANLHQECTPTITATIFVFIFILTPNLSLLTPETAVG